jgi:hypothetical protein
MKQLSTIVLLMTLCLNIDAGKTGQTMVLSTILNTGRNDLRIKMTKDELLAIQPYDDPDFFYFNYEEALINPLFKKSGKKSEEQMFAALTKGQKLFYSNIDLMSQIYNGGVGQYFFNGYNIFIDYAVKSLKLCGSDSLAVRLESLNRFFKEKKAIFNELKKNDKFPDYTKLLNGKEFDKAFFDQSVPMQKKMVDYILANSQEFIKE